MCAASYEARRFGVRSAMPSATAGRLCPKGMFVPPRMGHYREESQKIMRIVEQSGAAIEQVSIDEAYLELSSRLGQTSEAEGDEALYGALPIARQLKQNILAERGLTASIGIAPNKLLAKLASDFQKPDGLTLIPARDSVLFLRPMSIRVIHGIGKVTEHVLNQAGIVTVGDLQDYTGDLRALVGAFGPG